MTDFAPLFLIAGSIALVVAPAILLNRWLAGADGPSLADILAIPVNPPWPRGVQEEEPVRWQVEALRPRRALRHMDVAGRAADRQVVGVGAESPRCA